ncbi:hypothetical protein [Priestia sp. YIM B13486]|uniref:hypothetical protein n=1 Tax=Priestia sp. YIM B13486 TaxID=3366304 RepID=UPI00367311A5
MGEKLYQVFVTVDTEGNVTSAQVGRYIVQTEPFDFFFIEDEETGKDLQTNAKYYKVVLNGFKASLVQDEPAVEETPTEPTNPTE